MVTSSSTTKYFPKEVSEKMGPKRKCQLNQSNIKLESFHGNACWLLIPEPAHGRITCDLTNYFFLLLVMSSQIKKLPTVEQLDKINKTFSTSAHYIYCLNTAFDFNLNDMVMSGAYSIPVTTNHAAIGNVCRYCNKSICLTLFYNAYQRKFYEAK